MNTREITNIYAGSTQGSRMYLGGELVWPIGTTGDTPTPDTGDTGTTENRLIGIFDIASTEMAYNILYASNGVTKIELADGTEITSRDRYVFPETGMIRVYYTLSNNTIPTRMLAYQLNRLREIIVPEGIVEIGVEAFASINSPNCNLTAVTLSNTVETLNSQVFNGCDKLVTIAIPSSVTEIGQNCFYDCSGLTEMIFEGTTPPLLIVESGYLLQNLGQTSYTFPIYVPDSAVSAYQTAYPDYASRITGISNRPNS